MGAEIYGQAKANAHAACSQLSLEASCWLVAVVRVLTDPAGPGGRHSPQPERPGSPRPISDVHIQVRRLYRRNALQTCRLFVDR